LPGQPGNVAVTTARIAPDLDSQDQGTWIPVANSLTGLFNQGGVPQSITELHDLEEQQRRVAAAAADCTVSVKIGPAQGCGVIITGSGFILTAAHVAMRPGMPAEIFLSDGRKVQATSLGMNRNVDAGLMKINPNQNGGRPWPHASLGSSKDLVSGMWCIATGHPGGYDQQRGPVTRVGRILAVRDLAIVTDCALIGGDSGGPLFDLSGKLIAVHSRIGNDVSDNLHVPIDHYAASWDRMRQSVAWGYLPGFKPVLGVTGSKSASQAIIEIVRTGSPAHEAGLQAGDVIEEFGDKLITNFESLQAAVADTMPGERVRLLVSREGTTRIIVVEIGRAED
jgi:S1-C subfamily serine protease